ncbi:hypothetical protein E2C01_039637 [Portunus trituberculatus]|uniref:Uncharacterized protein n=1 Tax=Portunus trituberculatus TaxID=210409 RepID=A0A5B7FF90_PORTR|nr:hypothetical protein [Portunus trituberculatus]
MHVRRGLSERDGGNNIYSKADSMMLQEAGLHNILKPAHLPRPSGLGSCRDGGLLQAWTRAPRLIQMRYTIEQTPTIMSY